MNHPRFTMIMLILLLLYYITATDVVVNVIGLGTCGFNGDGGQATNATLCSPAGVALDTSGNFYIADSSNNRIRKVTASTGVITTIAGTGDQSFSGDGGQATSAKLSRPNGVAVDSSGNVYIIDSDKTRIRKVTTLTSIIDTIAGTGSAGYNCDNCAATSAQLYLHHSTLVSGGVAVDSTGNVYIADSGNHRVRKVAVSTNVITTIAGDGTLNYSGDNGQATSSTLYYPCGVALDTAGNVYIADSGNGRIRKVTVSTGIISTIAGGGSIDFTIDGVQATSSSLISVDAIALDAAGNVYVYVTYSGDHLIRKVTVSTGIISTIAGNTDHHCWGKPTDGFGWGTNFYSFLYFGGMVIDSSDNVYILDQNAIVTIAQGTPKEKTLVDDIVDCIGDHHHGSRSFDSLECDVCPLFRLTYPKSTFKYNCPVSDYYPVYHDCFRSNTLYGISCSTVQFAVVMAIVASIILMALFSVRDTALTAGILGAIALPCMDFCTDLAYVILQPFVFPELFALCLAILSVPWFHFIYHLVQIGAHPKMLLVEMPNELFFESYDSIFKLLLTGSAYVVFLVINGNVLWLFVGGFLYAAKVFPIGTVSNFWFYYWVGDNKFETKSSFNSEVHNQLLYTELMLESLPQFALQLVNAGYLSSYRVQNFSATSIVSIIASLLMTMNGLYRLVYIKLYLGKNLSTLPVDLTLKGLIPVNNNLNNAHASRVTTESGVDGEPPSSKSNTYSENGIELVWKFFKKGSIDKQHAEDEQQADQRIPRVTGSSVDSDLVNRNELHVLEEIKALKESMMRLGSRVDRIEYQLLPVEGTRQPNKTVK